MVITIKGVSLYDLLIKLKTTMIVLAGASDVPRANDYNIIRSHIKKKYPEFWKSPVFPSIIKLNETFQIMRSHINAYRHPFETELGIRDQRREYINNEFIKGFNKIMRDIQTIELPNEVDNTAQTSHVIETERIYLKMINRELNYEELDLSEDGEIILKEALRMNAKILAKFDETPNHLERVYQQEISNNLHNRNYIETRVFHPFLSLNYYFASHEGVIREGEPDFTYRNLIHIEAKVDTEVDLSKHIDQIKKYTRNIKVLIMPYLITDSSQIDENRVDVQKIEGRMIIIFKFILRNF